MIAHYKMNVGSLSAISADIGNVSAGNIAGVNITGSAIHAGPAGNVVIDGNGISIPDGTAVSGYRLALGGAEFWGANDQSLYCSAGLFAYGNIGTNGDLFAQGDLVLGAGEFRWDSPPATTFQDQPLVWSSGNKQIYRRTDGITGSMSNPTFIEVRGGLVVDLL